MNSQKHTRNKRGERTASLCNGPYMYVLPKVQEISSCEILGQSPIFGYHNIQTGSRSFFLSFGDNVRLEVMTKPQMTDGEKERNRTGFIHLSFSVGSKEQVDMLTAQLKTDGFEVADGPRTTGDGYYESCIVGFEGNLIEITV